MAAEDQCDLARVIGIVGDQAEEHRLARVVLDAATALTLVRLPENRRRPAREAAGDDLPARLEGLDELGRASRGVEVILPAKPAPVGEGRRFGAWLAEDVAEPVDPGTRGVAGDGQIGQCWFPG